MSPASRDVPIAGLIPFSTVDWPDRLCAVLFTQGCPWRCGYCHNPALIETRAPSRHRWEDLLAWLRRRRGLLDGVIFSGGEPTLHPGLLDAVRSVHEEGFAVGLHTGGPWPRRLASLLPHLDWVGLDVKATPAGYPAVTGAGPSGAAAYESLRLLVASGVDHEVRTTVDPTVHTRDDVLEIAALVAAAGARQHVLQEARDVGQSVAWRARLRHRRLSDVLEPGDLPQCERRGLATDRLGSARSVAALP